MLGGPPIRTASDQRRTTRVACEIPAQVTAGEGHFDGVLLDVSRGGVRLRVPGARLGVYRLAPLGVVARQVAAVLGETFRATFNPARLGLLITKTLRPVRIGQRDGTSADVDLGCALDSPLSDLEASALGLALPVLAADGSEGTQVVATHSLVVRPAPPAAPPPAPPARSKTAPTAPAPVASSVAAPAAPARAVVAAPKPEPARTMATAPSRRAQAVGKAQRALERWRAYVHPRGDRRLPPFLAAPEAVTSQGVQVRVTDRATLTLKGGADVASTIIALDEAYGTDVALKLVDGPTHLWTGPARIEEVEVPTDAPKEMSMWLSFARHLRPAEMRALGLE